MVGQEEGGSIINLGDWASERPYLHYAAYFASKGAIPAPHSLLRGRIGNAEPQGSRQLHPSGPRSLPARGYRE